MNNDFSVSKAVLVKEHVKKVWALARPYFNSQEKWVARFMLTLTILLNLGMVYIAVLFNDWNGAFYDALQNKNEAVFWKQMGVFSGLAALYILVAVYRFYITQVLEMKWRTWMTQDLVAKWVKGNAFYAIESGLGAKGSVTTDNPDQRIQEDVQAFTSETLGLALGLLNSVVTLCSFVGILWGLSGPVSFQLGTQLVTIPGFMVWVAVAYALTGSVLGHYLGRPLTALNVEQQKRDANFRHHLVRVREYAEAIALDKGGASEGKALSARFLFAMENFKVTLGVRKRYTWFNSAYSQAAVVFPFIVAAPRYFAGTIQLGQLMQISSAFGRVQDALSWLVDNYPSLASWAATTRRLTDFVGVLNQHEQSGSLPEPVAVNAGSWGISGIHASLKEGRVILSSGSVQAFAGDSILVHGDSGSGKSTLFKVIAGVWPGSDMKSVVPEGSVFLPQKPYFPSGTLRSALCYPSGDVHDDSVIKEMLSKVGLADLVSSLDEEAVWARRLSGGELQRLSVARVGLAKPKWVFADEAFSALDTSSANALRSLVIEWAKEAGGALISVEHGLSNQQWSARWSVQSTLEGSVVNTVRL